MRRIAALAVLMAQVAIACGGSGGADSGASPSQTDGGRDVADTIVIDEAIGPVGIGMVTAELRAAIGRPDEVGPSDLHGGWERWRYRDRRLTVTVTESGEVWDVRTRSDRYSSKRGLRVGLREAGVRRRLPAADCHAYGGPARYRRWRVCTTGAQAAGPFTRVLLVRGIAREIRIARGLAV
jgi:hypothetical protein